MSGFLKMGIRFGKKIVIQAGDETIEIITEKRSGQWVGVGIKAPKHFRILREENLNKKIGEESSQDADNEEKITA